ncbi:MAG: oligosaccharide flippase family protein [Novosphingobium sp.]
MIAGQLRGILTAATGFLARASNQIASVVTTFVAIGFLSPTEFGVFALASIAVTLIRVMLHTGAFEYLLKARSASECSSESLVLNLALAVSLTLLLWLGAGLAHVAFGPSQIITVLAVMAPSNLIAAASAWRESLLLRTGRLKLYYLLTTITEGLALVATVALLYAGYGVYALVVQVYLRNVMLLALYLQTGPITWSLGWSRAKLAEVFNWSLTRYASVFLNFGVQYGADLLLGIFLSPAATGIYRASSRLVTAVSDLFAHPLRLMAMTFFSARAAQGRSSAELWPILAGVVAAVAWPALAGLAILADHIVPLVLGQQWLAAAPLVPIICVAHALGLLDGVTSTVLVCYNHQRLVFTIQIIASVLMIVLIACAAPFGLMPAAVAAAVGALVTSSIFIVAALRHMPGSQRPLRQALPVAAALGAATWIGAAWALGAATRAGAPQGLLIASAVAGGIACWLLVLALVHRHALALIGPLQDRQPPADLVLAAEQP